MRSGRCTERQRHRKRLYFMRRKLMHVYKDASGGPLRREGDNGETDFSPAPTPAGHLLAILDFLWLIGR